jgi:hypothetical protein
MEKSINLNCSKIIYPCSSFLQYFVNTLFQTNKFLANHVQSPLKEPDLLLEPFVSLPQTIILPRELPNLTEQYVVLCIQHVLFLTKKYRAI